jgi:hypothetical protein
MGRSALCSTNEKYCKYSSNKGKTADFSRLFYCPFLQEKMKIVPLE